MNKLQLIFESLLLLTSIPKSWSNEDDVYYIAEFTDEIKDCVGFENAVFKCNSLTVGFIKGEGDEEGSLGLSGKLDVLADIIDEYTVVEPCARFVRIATTILPANPAVKQQYFVLLCFGSEGRIAGEIPSTQGILRMAAALAAPLVLNVCMGDGDRFPSGCASAHLSSFTNKKNTNFNLTLVIDLKVWKETDLAKEFMYAVSGSICGTLQKEDTPWWPLVKSLNSSECPIKQKVYPVQDMVLSLDFAKDVLRHEFVGDYEIQLSIMDQLENQLSCHIISAGISEKTKE